jgi:prepilin-type N-terminal cleavage/methylation domain-containing protein
MKHRLIEGGAAFPACIAGNRETHPITCPENKRVRRAGFTLLELLLAAAITALLAALLLAVASGAMDHWNRTAGRLRAAAEARLGLDQLAQDLESAIFRADGNVWLAATVLPGTTLSGQWRQAAASAQGKPGNAHPGTLNLGALPWEEARFGVAGVWLRFFTAKADTNAGAADLTAPVAVGYQIIRQNVTSSAASEQRYLLFRGEVRRTKTAGGSPGVFESGYDLNPAAAPATAYMTPNATAGDPGNLLRPPLGAALVDNVIDFGVRLYVREGGNLRLVFPAAPAPPGGVPAGGTPSQAAPPSAETEHFARWAAPAADDAYGRVFPDVAEVMIRVLDDEGARLLAAYEEGRLYPPAGISAGDYWWVLAMSHSQVLTRRIFIASHPL